MLNLFIFVFAALSPSQIEQIEKAFPGDRYDERMVQKAIDHAGNEGWRLKKITEGGLQWYGEGVKEISQRIPSRPTEEQFKENQRSSIYRDFFFEHLEMMLAVLCQDLGCTSSEQQPDAPKPFSEKLDDIRESLSRFVQFDPSFIDKIKNYIEEIKNMLIPEQIDTKMLDTLRGSIEQDREELTAFKAQLKANAIMRDLQYTSRRKIMNQIEQKKELIGSMGQIFGERLSDKDREHYNNEDKKVLAVINELEQDLERDGLKNPAHLEMDMQIKKLKARESALEFLEKLIITVWPKVKGMIA